MQSDSSSLLPQGLGTQNKRKLYDFELDPESKGPLEIVFPHKKPKLQSTPSKNPETLSEHPGAPLTFETPTKVATGGKKDRMANVIKNIEMNLNGRLDYLEGYDIEDDWVDPDDLELYIDSPILPTRYSGWFINFGPVELKHDGNPAIDEAVQNFILSMEKNPFRGKKLPVEVDTLFKEASVLILKHYEGQPPRRLLELFSLHLGLSEATIRVYPDYNPCHNSPFEKRMRACWEPKQTAPTPESNLQSTKLPESEKIAELLPEGQKDLFCFSHVSGPAG